MSKYPEVEQLFKTLFADEFGVVSAETRKALMVKSGRSGATVSRWIAGEARPDTDAWPSIALVAGVAVEEVAACLVPVTRRSGEPTQDASARLDAVEQVVRAQARVVHAFGRAARERLGEHDELVARLDDLEAALARLQAR